MKNGIRVAVVALLMVFAPLLSGCSGDQLTAEEKQDLATCLVLFKKDSSHLSSFPERKAEFRAEKWTAIEKETGYLKGKLLEYRELMTKGDPKPPSSSGDKGSFLPALPPLNESASEAQVIMTLVVQACSKLGAK